MGEIGLDPVENLFVGEPARCRLHQRLLYQPLELVRRPILIRSIKLPILVEIYKKKFDEYSLLK
jgi:hypothetical protein